MPNSAERAAVVALDVGYPTTGGAVGVAVYASDPHGANLVEEYVHHHSLVAEYVPGRFYERELPVLLTLLGHRSAEIVLIDGYVDLDPSGRQGLGAHLHQAIGLPVIGLAKTPFATATHAAKVHRGATATRPLHVTVAGLPQETAVDIVLQLHGAFRVPDIMRRADSLTRHSASAIPLK